MFLLHRESEVLLTPPQADQLCVVDLRRLGLCRLAVSPVAVWRASWTAVSCGVMLHHRPVVKMASLPHCRLCSENTLLLSQ